MSWEVKAFVTSQLSRLSNFHEKPKKFQLFTWPYKAMLLSADMHSAFKEFLHLSCALRHQIICVCVCVCCVCVCVKGEARKWGHKLCFDKLKAIAKNQKLDIFRILLQLSNSFQTFNIPCQRNKILLTYFTTTLRCAARRIFHQTGKYDNSSELGCQRCFLCIFKKIYHLTFICRHHVKSDNAKR